MAIVYYALVFLFLASFWLGLALTIANGFLKFIPMMPLIIIWVGTMIFSLVAMAILNNLQDKFGKNDYCKEEEPSALAEFQNDNILKYTK